MILRKVSFGVIAGVISLAIESLSTIITVWLLLKFLERNVAGLWLLCLSFMPLLTLAQAGLGPTIVRRFAAALAGSIADQQKMAMLAKRAFDVVILFVLIIFSLVYIFYFADASRNVVAPAESFVLYALFVLGLVIRVLALRRFQIMIGAGFVGWDRLALATGTVTSLLLTYTFLAHGKNATYIGVAYVVGAAVFYVASSVLYSRFLPVLARSKDGHFESSQLTPLFRESSGITILVIVNIIVMSADVWVVERLFGLQQVPAYVAQTKIVLLVSAVAGLVQQMIHPYIASAWSSGRLLEAQMYYKKGILCSLGLGAIGFGVIFVATPTLMEAWIGSGTFLGWPALVLQVLFGFIYINHVAFAYPVFATGNNPFIVASIVNALLSLPLSIALGLALGIHGVILGNMLGTLIPSVWVVLKAKDIFFQKSLS